MALHQMSSGESDSVFTARDRSGHLIHLYGYRDAIQRVSGIRYRMYLAYKGAWHSFASKRVRENWSSGAGLGRDGNGGGRVKSKVVTPYLYQTDERRSRGHDLAIENGDLVRHHRLSVKPGMRDGHTIP